MACERTTAITVNWRDLQAALTDHDPMQHAFLDRVTGEVVHAPEDTLDDPHLEAIWEQIDDDRDRYLEVEPLERRTTWRWLADFVRTVQDERLRDRLEVAIQGKGAFRRFKDVLGADRPELDRYRAFVEERERAAVVAWLEAEELVPANPPPWA